MRPVDPGSPEERTQPEPGHGHGPRRRPFGLYMILILLGLQTVLGAAVAAFVSLAVAMGAEDVSVLLQSDFWLTVRALGITLTAATVAVGLWRYRLWGWYGMMLLLAFWLATGLIAYFRGAPEYLSMALSVATVFYLNQREVRLLFEGQVHGRP